MVTTMTTHLRPLSFKLLWPNNVCRPQLWPLLPPVNYGDRPASTWSSAFGTWLMMDWSGGFWEHWSRKGRLWLEGSRCENDLMRKTLGRLHKWCSADCKNEDKLFCDLLQFLNFEYSSEAWFCLFFINFKLHVTLTFHRAVHTAKQQVAAFTFLLSTIE